MFKTLRFSFFILFTLASLAARGQFATKDRMLSGGFSMGYSNQNNKLSAQTNRMFSVAFMPQMSVFLSPHFSVGLGFDLYATRSAQMSSNLINNDYSISNRLSLTPQLIGQYYRPLNEKWYAAVRCELEPIQLELYQWSGNFSSGSRYNSPLSFNSDIQFRASFVPLIGYRASKHWLIEGQLGTLTVTADGNKTDSGSYKYFHLDGQFRPTLFNFRGIYLWSKKPPSVSK